MTKDDLLRAAIACDQLGAVDLGARLREAAENCVVVPREPTEAMIERGMMEGFFRTSVLKLYAAMLAAAQGGKDE